MNKTIKNIIFSVIFLCCFLLNQRAISLFSFDDIEPIELTGSLVSESSKMGEGENKEDIQEESFNAMVFIKYEFGYHFLVYHHKLFFNEVNNLHNGYLKLIKTPPDFKLAY